MPWYGMFVMQLLLHSFTEHLPRAEYDRKIEALSARAAEIHPMLRSQSETSPAREASDMAGEACERAATSTF
jgi:hypothetical protein